MQLASKKRGILHYLLAPSEHGHDTVKCWLHERNESYGFKEEKKPTTIRNRKEG